MKKKKSGIKKHKPVRIVNPTSLWHTARLHPCQSLLLKLRKPSTFLPACEDAKFEVILFGDFLLIEKVEFDLETGDKVYYINQKYDLTSWAEYGEVLLGEITVKLIDNIHPNKETTWNKEFRANVCIIMHGNNQVLTVVNPMGHTVKLEPHQLLEVVCFESSWNDWKPGMVEATGLRDSWRYTNSFDGGNLDLYQVKYEIAGDRSGVLAKEEGPFAIKNRFGLTPNPRLDKISLDEIKSDIKPIREHHWWFGCTEQTQKKVLDLGNNTYPICNLEFEGRSEGITDGVGYSSSRSLEVLLAVHGKNKHKMHPFHLNPESVEQKMEMTKRLKDCQQSLLTNPLSVEQIDFHPGYDEITVEIIQPNAFWTDLADDVRWEIKPDEHHLMPRNVIIAPQTEYRRWGKVFQRFRVEHNYKSKNDTEAKFLGAVFLICKEKVDHHDSTRRISFWFLHGQTKFSSSYSHNTTTTTARQYHTSHAGKKKDKDYNGTPKVCTVDFEEIDAQLLENSAKTRKITDIHVPHSYSTTNVNANWSDLENGKKKEVRSTWNRCLPLCLPNYPSGNANDEKDSTTEKTEKTDTGSNGAMAPFIIYCPDHLYRVTLKQGQALMVRMFPPYKMLDGKCVGEQWSLASHDEALKVEYFRTCMVRDTLCQEALIRVVKTPPLPGVHPVGCLRFECSESQRSLFVLVEKNSVRQGEFKTIQSNNVFEATNGKKLYLPDWQHDDAIIVSPSETFYIRNPSNTSAWASSRWHVEIEQFPLPDAVWQSESLKNIMCDIDVENPWFKTFSPLQLASTYVFRSLEVQQPHVNAILQSIIEMTDAEALPIAKLTFRNNVHQMNSCVATPFGVIDYKFDVARSLYVYVSLKGFVRRQLIMDNPRNKEEVVLHDGDMLVVKLAPCFIEVERAGEVECSWYTGSIPSYLDYRGMKRENRENVFRFKVKPDTRNKKDWLKFICGNTEKMLLVKKD